MKMWTKAIERRRESFPQIHEKMESLRLIHNESEDLRLDKVGEHLVGGWWKDLPPSESEKKQVREFMESQGFSSWYYNWRPSKGVSADISLVEESLTSPPQRWAFEENGVSYWARRDQGHSYGLFLDQRHNRRWVRESSQDQRVLNLFCFTGGFSVCAAVGGAKQVVSVDLQKNYLQWAEENFALNGRSPERDNYEFRAMDSMEYLSYAQRKGFKFDIIICDPPSFSRNRKKVFRIDKDYKSLICSCASILNPGGRLLFCTNYEKWGVEKWSEQLTQSFGPYSGAVPVETRWGERDFEIDPQKAILKSFLLSKA